MRIYFLLNLLEVQHDMIIFSNDYPLSINYLSSRLMKKLNQHSQEPKKVARNLARRGRPDVERMMKTVVCSSRETWSIPKKEINTE